jgi:hypothetical protein
MRIYKTFQVRKDFPVKFICNKCGLTLDNETQYGLEEWQADFIHKFKVSFGYGSLRDGESVDFDLCENCLEELFKSFKIPEQVERLFF